MSGKPAARVADMHTCSKHTGTIPHVGGPVVGGSSNVFINGRPAARVGDRATCQGPPDRISEGSATVLLTGNQPLEWVTGRSMVASLLAEVQMSS